MTVFPRLEGWLDERSDLPGQLRRFLGKPLPSNIGWIHTLGSLLLVYLLFQTVTGILLALYYSPAPEHAHASVRFIRNELTFGTLVHQLHHHGASFIMATAVLHLTRSFVLGAYKKPRELLWMSGVALLVLLTGFAFTGYLLPYDQNGYWASVVGLNLMADAPLVGPAARQLLTGGYEELGAVALSRFFLLHICVLPLALLALVGFHLRVLQKTGSAGPIGAPDPPGASRPFFPLQAFKDVVVAAAGAVALLLVALLVPVEDHGPASTNLGSFEPRPEWYFLPHFELLRRTPAGLQQFATFWLPAAGGAALFLLPWIDRGADRAPSRRKGVMLAGLAALLAAVMLGVLGARHGAADTQPPPGGGDLDPVARGRALFFGDMECSTCHVVDGEGVEFGPDLSRVASKVKDDFFAPFLRDPASFYPLTDMPAFDGTEQELQAILAYLRTLK